MRRPGFNVVEGAGEFRGTGSPLDIAPEEDSSGNERDLPSSYGFGLGYDDYGDKNFSQEYDPRLHQVLPNLNTTRTTPYTTFIISNATEAERGIEASHHLTSRETTILLGTLIPAVLLILILSIALIYVLHKLHRRTFSRVGSSIENKASTDSEIRSSLQTNGHAHRPQSQNSGVSRNGTTNGVLRAWEDNEVSNRRELNHP